MKRYDSPEQMHAALDVFLFDTLTDPNFEVTSAPEEPAFDMTQLYTVTIDVDSELCQFNLNHLPATSAQCEQLAKVMLTSPTNPAMRDDRLALIIALLQRARDTQ